MSEYPITPDEARTIKTVSDSWEEAHMLASAFLLAHEAREAAEERVLAVERVCEIWERTRTTAGGAAPIRAALGGDHEQPETPEQEAARIYRTAGDHEQPKPQPCSACGVVHTGLCDRLVRGR